MNKLLTFYKEQIEKNQQGAAEFKKKLFASSILRLSIFVLGSLGVYFLFGNAKAVLAVILICAVLFLFLVARHTDLQYKRAMKLALIQMNEVEVAVLNRKFDQLHPGDEFKNDAHVFSQDIDLFGEGSFFQYCNRTTLVQGKSLLVEMLTANTIDDISKKQNAIKELASMPKWRQHFAAVATLIKTETSYKTILSWLQKYQFFVPAIMRYVPTIFSFLSLAVLIGYFVDLIPVSGLAIWLFVGLGITGLYIKKVNVLAAHTSKVQGTFQQYQKLILEIEEFDFKAELLQEEKQKILQKSKKVSDLLKEFSNILNALEHRNNIFFGFLGNAFLLWDLRQSYRLEQWIKKNGAYVEEWFHTIAFFDAYSSLGNFAFNHPAYSFPQLSNKGIVLHSKEASHPLLDPLKSVANDIVIDREQFFIITGANMAGKSTFLRTVSLQIVMANLGLPVCASEVVYNPIKLITSMRTTDSLTDDESYFFSELKRLKFIVDQIKEEEYFIVLDEILKGTNSTDKAIGSRKFIERLVASNSTGIIATHDLSLCEVAKGMPQVENYFFDAEIIDDELHFDYTFKKGICQNMNASFLLKKMEIIE